MGDSKVQRDVGPERLECQTRKVQKLVCGFEKGTVLRKSWWSQWAPRLHVKSPHQTERPQLSRPHHVVKSWELPWEMHLPVKSEATGGRRSPVLAV